MNFGRMELRNQLNDVFHQSYFMIKNSLFETWNLFWTLIKIEKNKKEISKDFESKIFFSFFLSFF